MTKNPLDVFSLKGHHALITGGGSGLGLGTARCFHAAGARVTLTGTNAAKLKAAADELGEGANVAVFDVTKFDDAEDFAARVEKDHGPVSILLNNAGNTIKKPFAEQTPADFRAVLDVHLGGAHALTRAFLPQIIKAGNGSILFTASMASFIGITNVIGYSAAKSAYVGMVRALSTDLAPQGVRVNGVAPGWIDTPMFQGAMAGDPARRAKVDARIPMKRYGSIEDIGWAMTYLASPAAGYVSGHIIVVDGGALFAF